MLTKSVSGVAAAGGGGAAEDYILIEDQKAQNTNGGAFTPANSWLTRTLNTIVEDDGGHASLSSNEITLADGTYRYRASGPAHAVAGHQVRLFNVSDATVIKEGTTAFTLTTISVNTESEVVGELIIATSKIIRLEHNCQTAKSPNGFGAQANRAIEIYSRVELWKES